MFSKGGVVLNKEEKAKSCKRCGLFFEEIEEIKCSCGGELRIFGEERKEDNLKPEHP